MILNICWEGTDWIDVVQGSNKRWTVVNAEMNVRIPYTVEHCSPSRGNISFSKGLVIINVRTGKWLILTFL